MASKITQYGRNKAGLTAALCFVVLWAFSTPVRAEENPLLRLPYVKMLYRLSNAVPVYEVRFSHTYKHANHFWHTTDKGCGIALTLSLDEVRERREAEPDNPKYYLPYGKRRRRCLADLKITVRELLRLGLPGVTMSHVLDPEVWRRAREIARNKSTCKSVIKGWRKPDKYFPKEKAARVCRGMEKKDFGRGYDPRRIKTPPPYEGEEVRGAVFLLLSDHLRPRHGFTWPKPAYEPGYDD